MARNTYSQVQAGALPPAMMGAGMRTDNGGNPGGLDAEQIKNATTIVAVGRALGINDNGIIAALATAQTESGFTNLANSTVPNSLSYPHPGTQSWPTGVASDHDSVGVFQQRANQGPYAAGTNWMLDLKLGMDVAYQAAAYFGASPNSKEQGMLQIAGWQNMNPAQLSQAIQHSAPNAYGGAISLANTLMGHLGNTGPAQLPFKPTAVGPNYRPPAAPTPQQAMPRGGGRGNSAPYGGGYTSAKSNPKYKGSYQNPGNGGTYYGGGYASAKGNPKYKPLQGKVFQGPPKTNYGGGYTSARPNPNYRAPARGYSSSRSSTNYGGGYTSSRRNPSYNGGGSRPYGGGYTSSRPTTYYGGGYTSSRPTAQAAPAPQYQPARASGGARFR